MARGRRVRRAVFGGIVASALVVGLAACQEDDLPVGPGTATTPAATASAGQDAPAANDPASLRAADYVLTGGPETAGFDSSDPGPDSGSDASLMRQEVAECVGVTDFNPSEPFDQTTGDVFTSVEESEFQATSRAKILPEAEIRQYAEIVTSPRFGECYQGALEEALAGAEGSDGFTYEIVAVETPQAPPGATALVRTSMGISDDYGTYGYVFDVVYFYDGDVAVELEVHNIADVPPPAVEQDLIDQIAGKLANQ